jgi:hypothetical protein
MSLSSISFLVFCKIAEYIECNILYAAVCTCNFRRLLWTGAVGVVHLFWDLLKNAWGQLHNDTCNSDDWVLVATLVAAVLLYCI